MHLGISISICVGWWCFSLEASSLPACQVWILVPWWYLSACSPLTSSLLASLWFQVWWSHQVFYLMLQRICLTSCCSDVPAALCWLTWSRWYEVGWGHAQSKSVGIAHKTFSLWESEASQWLLYMQWHEERSDCEVAECFLDSAPLVWHTGCWIFLSLYPEGSAPCHPQLLLQIKKHWVTNKIITIRLDLHSSKSIKLY